jgi:long-subunit fatty acid transport protein
MQMIRGRLPFWLLGMVLYTSRVTANTEPPPAYDARSVGMGSTGVAHVHNGASLFHNPAALQGVKQLAITGDFSPFAPQMSAPLAGPETEVKSQRSIFPMFLLGGAYRVHPKLTLGLAVFPTMGFGATYESAPMLNGAKIDAQLAAIEIAPGGAFAITDDFSVGLAYRATYMSYGVESPIPAPGAPAGTMIPSKVDLSGWNFLGVQAGLFLRATRTTRLGLTYRNKVPVNMSGTTDLNGQQFDTEMEFASPHTFKLGVAQALLDDQLVLALDLKLGLYKDSGKNLTVKMNMGAGMQAQEPEVLDWKNALGLHAGAEYRVVPEVMALRAGYSLAQSATPESRANPVMPPPGLVHAVHLGFGTTLAEAVDLDLGGYYVFGGQHASPVEYPAGDYRMDGILGALSATYRL